MLHASGMVLSTPPAWAGWACATGRLLPDCGGLALEASVAASVSM
jgi:hypothetical protein